MQRKAFTLIELLTVIAILSVLLTILSPALVGIMAFGKRTVCGNNMAKLGQAYTHYSSENKLKLLNADTAWDTENGTTINRCWVGRGNTVRSIVEGQMWPYVESMAAYRCTNPINEEYLRSYSINARLNGEGGWEKKRWRLGRAQRLAYRQDERHHGPQPKFHDDRRGRPTRVQCKLLENGQR